MEAVRQPKGKNFQPRKPKPASDSLSWDIPATPQSPALPLQQVEQWSIEEPVPTVVQTIESVSVVETVTVTEEKIIETMTVVEEQEVSLIQDEIIVNTIVTEEVIEEKVVQVAEEVEEDVVVLMPKMPARRQAALEIEPSPVLLPIKVPIKMGANIHFGSSPSASAGGNKLVFGEPKPELKVEELFTRPSAASTSATVTGAYATTSVDAAISSPPGLSTSSPIIHDQHQYKHFEQLDTTSRRQPHHVNSGPASYYSQPHRAYDSYSQGQRYDHSGYSQRYAPYVGAQANLEEAFAPTYYGNTRGGQAAASSGGYYPYPHMMYSNDPYTSAAAFGHPAAPTTSSSSTTTRYQPSHGGYATSGYAASNNPYSPGASANAPHHQQHPQTQQQQQQPHYSQQQGGSSPNPRNNSRIF